MSCELMVLFDDDDRTRRRQVAGVIVRLFKDTRSFGWLFVGIILQS